MLDSPTAQPPLIHYKPVHVHPSLSRSASALSLFLSAASVISVIKKVGIVGGVVGSDYAKRIKQKH